MPTRYFLFLVLPFSLLGQNAQQIQALHNHFTFDTVLSFSGPPYESLQIAHLRKGKKEALYFLSWEHYYDQYGNDSSVIDESWALIDFKKQSIGTFFPIDPEGLFIDELLGEDIALAISQSRKGKALIFRRGDYDYYQYHISPQYFKAIDINYRMGSYIAVQDGKKWFWYDWFTQERISDFPAENASDLIGLAEGSQMDSYSFQVLGKFQAWKKGLFIDQIKMDPINGDGVFIVRNHQNQLWGMYQDLGDSFQEIIPMQYDSIRFYPWNSPITTVYRDGKLGFYLSYWSYDSLAKEVIPCEYHDYKRYEKDDGKLYLAIQKEGQWAWIDWANNILKSELKYESLDDLPYPYYQQEYWPTEEGEVSN